MTKPSCYRCIPNEGCPNFDVLKDPCLAETCEDYLDAEFYYEVEIPDDWSNKKAIIESILEICKKRWEDK